MGVAIMVEEPGVGDGGRLRDDDACACCSAVAVVAVAGWERSEWGCLQRSVRDGKDVFAVGPKDVAERSWPSRS